MEYYVVVFLNPAEDLNWPEISYHTILQKWQVPTPLNSDDAGHDESVTLTVHQLTSRINDLMERLCGKRPS